MTATKKKGNTTSLKNRKAYHDYNIIEKFEAGIELMGTEVKSIRANNVSFKDSFVRIEKGQAFLVGLHIAKYRMSKFFNHEPVRKRRLLLHKSQIRKLFAKVSEKGLTIVPLKIYIKHGLIKVEIGLAKGKQLFDKRESIKRKDMAREWKRKGYS
ncbi:MAG: SsrA-binding protein SmpB [Candidatus Muiribacteriaceae bacterium]